MVRSESTATVVEQAIEIIERSLPDLRLVVAKSKPGRAFRSFRARSGRIKLHFEVKFLSQVRIRDLLGQLAAGGLEARQEGAAKGLEPVVLLVAPRFGRESLQEAERFMARYLPDVSWGLLELSGGLRLHIDPLGLDLDRPRVATPGSRAARQPRVSFSDLNRWMLKILLLKDAPESIWPGPRLTFFNPQQFQQAAHVSVDKAYKFLRMLEENDFLRRGADGLVLVRRVELIEHWFAVERLRPPRRHPVRNILGRKLVPATLAAAGGKEPRVALGGFAACTALGISNSSNVSVDLHVRGELKEFLASNDLELCHSEVAGLDLLVSDHPESIFRGLVRHGPTWVVDVFQAALDVAPSPARGHEQAEYILEHVLGVR